MTGDLSRGPEDDATDVVAMAYDRAQNAAQQIYSAPMTYGNFLEWSAKPELLDAATLPYGNTTALYLLVTDRHRLQPEASGTLADPNGAAMGAGPLPWLLEAADRASAPALAGAVAGSGFDVAWTSKVLSSENRRRCARLVEHGSSSEIIMCDSGEPSVRSACLPPSAAGRQQCIHGSPNPLAGSPPAPCGLHSPLISASTALRLEPVQPRSGELSRSMTRLPTPPR